MKGEKDSKDLAELIKIIGYQKPNAVSKYTLMKIQYFTV